MWLERLDLRGGDLTATRFDGTRLRQVGLADAVLERAAPARRGVGGL
ncbi:MAG: hypothetical protein R3F43_01650 [bacterium]